MLFNTKMSPLRQLQLQIEIQIQIQIQLQIRIQIQFQAQILQTIPVNNCRNVAKPNCRQIAEEQCREVTFTSYYFTFSKISDNLKVKTKTRHFP